MPRSSRHKSQRSRKHGDGELEGDASSRDRRVKQEEKDSAARVSVKSSSSKDLILMSNGGEKKRKDRGEGSMVVVVDDRWNGGAEDEQVGEKKPKGEVFEGVDSEKGKGKGSESKSRSSRRHDGLSEGAEPVRPKTEKESSRRDSSGSQYKNSKEREKDSGKDVKERDRDYNKESKERDRDYGRDGKEKDRDHIKDAKEKEKEKDHGKDAKEKEKERDHGKDLKEKERDHSKDSKEKERDHGKDAKEKERDRDHSKDVKERERDYNKEAKEKEKEKEKDRDYNKDVKEKDRDYSKDAKEKERDYSRDAKEKERDYSRDVKEKDRDYNRDTKEKDREYSKDGKEKDRENPKDAKERDRGNSRDAKERDKEIPRDAKERDRDYAKDAKEKDRDYAKDAKEKDRDYAKEREKDHLKDAKDRERDYPKDPKERDRDHPKDPRERSKDYPKDVKERDAKERDPKERDKDHHKEVKDRDREYYKEDRDRDYHKDVKDRDRENYKDVKERDPKDARERDRDYTRDTKERDKDYKDPRDRDREYYRDPRDRDRDNKDARDRGTERDKRVQDARHERSDDLASRKQTSKMSTSGDEHGARKNTEIAGGKTQDGLRNPEPDKELDKSTRRRDGSGDKARYVGDVRDNDDRRFSSRDDHMKNSSNKDEGQREGRYRDKYREDHDRDQRDHDDRVRDERTSREHNNSKSGSKHFRDENRFSEGHYKKSKIQETDRGTKDSHDDVEKYPSSNSKLDPRSDRGRIDYLHADKVDASLGRPKSSPSAVNHTMKDQLRASSKQGGPSGRMPPSEEKQRLNTASRGDNVAASGFHEREPEAWSSDKRRPKEGFRSAEVDHAAHYDRTPKSDARPSHLAQKSPSTGGDRRFPGARRSFDIEGHKSNSSKHGRDSLNTNRDRGMPMSNDHFRGDKFESEPNPPGLPPFNRTSYLPGSSPGHLPPPPVIGHVTGGPSLLGTYEDDSRVQSGDRKPNSRFRRSGEHGMGRGQGNAWKSPSTWQSPVQNGFMSPHPGFHPSVQQFTSPLYGVPPSMELNHPGYMHDAPDRFNHVRPFGWHNPMDDRPPRMPVWDGRNGGFVDDPHMYGREWDINRQMMSNRGWEMNPDMWKGQNGNMELPMPQESQYSAGSEAWNGQTGTPSHKDRDPSECLPTVDSEVKYLNEKPPAKTGVECPQKNVYENTTEPSKPAVPETTSNVNGKILVCCNYLSKLDISLDLAQSDLYQECMSLLGTQDKADLNINISKEENAQSKKGGLIVSAQSGNNILSSVFPSGTDDVFQRAMSLYKKHNWRKAKTNSSLSPSYGAEQKGVSEVDEQTTSVDTPVEDKMKVDKQTSFEGSLASADSASSFGEGKKTPIDRETSCPSEEMELQSDCIADAVDFVEGSQTCETIMGECRVNVSRIHLSPGSTH